jgi:hypothetical protein
VITEARVRTEYIEFGKGKSNEMSTIGYAIVRAEAAVIYGTLVGDVARGKRGLRRSCYAKMIL